MIALITGATSGIGEASARKLASLSYNLIITGRRLDRLELLASELESNYGVKVKCLNFDVRSNDEVKKYLGSLNGEWSKIDVLLNNAGLASGLSSIQEGDVDDWEKMIDTNVKGLLYVTRVISQYMIPRSKGLIVNIGSIAGREVYPNGNVYCSTKHAVGALTQAMRIDMLEHNIKVSSIDPGMVDTEFSLVRLGDKEKADAVYDGLTPLHAEDIADALEFIVTRPAHVNINDMLIMPTAQASARIANRK